MSSLEQMRVQLEELADRLKLRSRTVTRALRLLERLNREHRSYVQGSKPLGVSASCLYLTGLLEGEGPSQRDLCGATDWKISEPTIRRHYQGIAEKLQLAALPAISSRRRIPRRHKYVCPLCGEPHKNLEPWKLHIKHDHRLLGWGLDLVRTRDFDIKGNLANRQLLERIREAERQWAQAKETLDRIDGTMRE